MMDRDTQTLEASPAPTSTVEYYVPTDPMDDLQCESCQ
ncbi:MAG: hypothetical protein JWP85_219 [Rhodoglobus sp.]|nr:hypothetical protein [Rhodoglobus sp.]